MSLQNLQNNLAAGQNIIVNQVPMQHQIIQNNGIVSNSIPHENQMVQQNHIAEAPQHSQQMQQVPVQSVQSHSIPVQQQQNSIPAVKSIQTHHQNHNSMSNSVSSTNETMQVLTKQRLQDLIRETDQTLNLEEEVEEIILGYVDEFVDRCLNGAALIAKNRRVNTIEVKDVQQFLNRNYNMWTPGFGTDELKPYKRSLTTEAHKQRTALIRKTLKKY